MRAAGLLLGVLLGAVPTGKATAEIPPLPDDVSLAFSKAAGALAAGEDRAKVLAPLVKVIDDEKNTASPYFNQTRALAADLKDSAKAAPKPATPKEVAADPVRHLRDTKFPVYLLAYPDNWAGSLGAHLKDNPDDPVSRLLARDRGAIADLIPLLADRTPTRAFHQSGVSGDWSHVPRVCDFAVLLIEYHSLCKFHDNATSGSLLHELPVPDHTKVAERVAEWWAENKTKSVAAGVRDQLGRVNFHAKFWMARHLIRLGVQGDPKDKEFGLEVLREHVRRYPRNHTAATAAGILAEYGDFTPRDVFRDEWASWLGKPGLIHDSSIAFYLCAHGTRREWELLHAISVEEVRDKKGPGSGAVWACVVNSGKAGTQPYAIPVLGLALTQTQITGSRSAAGGKAQAFSYADTATELLQKQTGKDFGYRADGSDDERAAAIARARKWWDDEGKAKYTFDNIEKDLKAKERAKQP